MPAANRWIPGRFSAFTQRFLRVRSNANGQPANGRKVSLLLWRNPLALGSWFSIPFQGKKVYYHKIIIESTSGKEIVSVKCITTASPAYNVMMNATTGSSSTSTSSGGIHGLVKRDVLPAGFQEPE